MGVRTIHIWTDLLLPFKLVGRHPGRLRTAWFLVLAPSRALIDCFRPNAAYDIDRFDQSPASALFTAPWFRRSSSRGAARSTSAAVLFVDLTASSYYKQLLGDSYHDWWISRILLFHHIARGVVEVAGGRYAKNIGDEILAYFDGPDACQSALRAAGALDWWFRVKNDQIESNQYDIPDWALGRAALDYGTVWFLYEDDPFGPPVDRAARMMSKAQPEEIMISEAFRENLGNLDETWSISFEDVTDERGSLKDFVSRFFVVRGSGDG